MNEKRVKISFSVFVFIERDNNGYHAFCPALKGLHTTGSTLKETKESVKNAIEAYLISLIKHRDPIPLGIIEEKKPKKKYLLSSKHQYYENLVIETA